MAEALLAVLFVAASAYVLLGGADFGAGMVEAMLGRRGDDGRVDGRVDAAIAPVWEANHVWLVLVAVLAFVGFPRLYVELATYLHVPLLLLLLGVVARGAAFTFRHYDPIEGGMQRGYATVFRLSSALTPLFVGVVVAAAVDGRMGACEGRGFYACFIAPWNTAFAWATGVFVSLLFAFEGTALLAAEHGRPDRGRGRALLFIRLARRLHLATIACGALVLVAAWHTHSPWFDAFIASRLGTGAVAVATALVPLVAFAFTRARPQLVRLSMGAQTLAIMFGFFAPSYPVLVRLRGGDHVVMPEAAAAPAVLRQLGIAVVVGLALILPALVYLIRVYKSGPDSGPGQPPPFR